MGALKNFRILDCCHNCKHYGTGEEAKLCKKGEESRPPFMFVEVLPYGVCDLWARRGTDSVE